ncbi:collagen-like triple helix repeat-containing protein [Aquimarina sp. 2201CG14-23]|uniref:collagen-like triple helix repeat-containing protein n=1 Tax=Aquimarina mycalae TaxID=3040073 RepID=UPI002477E163|nr:collagen-like protein [Aquimarina sp. 2201CG14-23]MDH7446252.1 collagen-like protein [Aquimarina sp. 2201CG14-23]
MKAMKNLIGCIAILLISASIISCEGEDGAVGPQGEQGLQGDQGPQGDQGDPGTANVIYSDWIIRDYENSGGLAEETNTQLLATLGVGDFDLTQDILLVYGRREINAIVTEINQLPYIAVSDNDFYGFEVASFNGGFTLRVQVATLDGATSAFAFFDSFRYVIIPGGVGSTKSVNDYKKMSYEEVTALFNIK